MQIILIFYCNIKYLFPQVMTNIGPRRKEIVSKPQKLQEIIWPSSAETKCIGKQDGKTVLMAQVLLFGPWYVIKKVHYRQPRKMPAGVNVMFQPANGQVYGATDVIIRA